MKKSVKFSAFPAVSALGQKFCRGQHSVSFLWCLPGQCWVGTPSAPNSTGVSVPATTAADAVPLLPGVHTPQAAGFATAATASATVLSVAGSRQASLPTAGLAPLAAASSVTTVTTATAATAGGDCATTAATTAVAAAALHAAVSPLPGGASGVATGATCVAAVALGGATAATAATSTPAPAAHEDPLQDIVSSLGELCHTHRSDGPIANT